VYLLQIRIPDLSRGPRGSASTTFVPPHETPGENRISIDLQRFRLVTGVPIYVDFKSIPYKDVEVLEWRERLARTERWLNKPEWFPPQPITHVVMPAGAKLEFNTFGFDRVYADANYVVYIDRRKW